MQVHREAHGQPVERLFRLNLTWPICFLAGEVNSAGAVLLPGGATRADPIRHFVHRIVEFTSLTQTLCDDVAMELLQIHMCIRTR